MRWKSIALMMTAVAIYGATAFAAGSPAGPASPSTANPVTAEAVKGMAWILLAAVLGMALAAAGAAVSQAITASAALQGIARQPEASGKIFVPMILAIVFIETLAIYTLVVALLLIFTNPLKGLLT